MGVFGRRVIYSRVIQSIFWRLLVSVKVVLTQKFLSAIKLRNAVWHPGALLEIFNVHLHSKGSKKSCSSL